MPGSGKYIAPDYLVVRSTVHSIANLCAPQHSAVGGFESERCFALFVVAEEGVGRGGAGAGEGAQEGAAHR